MYRFPLGELLFFSLWVWWDCKSIDTTITYSNDSGEHVSQAQLIVIFYLLSTAIDPGGRHAIKKNHQS